MSQRSSATQIDIQYNIQNNTILLLFITCTIKNTNYKKMLVDDIIVEESSSNQSVSRKVFLLWVYCIMGLYDSLGLVLFKD